MTKIKNHLKILIFSCVVGMTLSGCSLILIGLSGMKNPKEVDEKTIVKYGKKYNIPQGEIYELDTSYLSFLFSLDIAKYDEQIKNHYQPLQALYYNNEGHLKSFQINCYAGGLPNLQWERDSIFSTFLPKVQAPLDSIVPLETHLKYLIPLTETETFSVNEFDYIVIVHWSRFMGKQSKRLIKIVQKNAKLSNDKDKKAKYIYVNNDNLFVKNL